MSLLATYIGMSSVGIQQVVASGAQFTGILPATTPVWGNGMNKFPVDTNAGLFLFNHAEPIVVTQYLFDFGTAAPDSYTFSLVNLTDDGTEISGESTIIDTGSAARLYVTTRMVLGRKQALKLVTVGATTAMFARVYAVLERTYRG